MTLTECLAEALAVFGLCNVPDDPARIADSHYAVGYIMGDNRAGTDGRIATNSHARQHCDITAEPDIVTHMNRF